MRSTVFVLLLVVSANALGQSKVTGPQTTTRRPDTDIAQIRRCLHLAKEISELTDRANVAKARGDTGTFNSVVEPYNNATHNWNEGCTRPYDPADMIRVENESGLRLCKFIQTPCLTEAERRAVLDREARQQQGQNSSSQSGALTRTTGRKLTRGPDITPPVQQHPESAGTTSAEVTTTLEIQGIGTHLYLHHTGGLSPSLTSDALLWNTVIGEGSAKEPSSSALIDVIVSGEPGGYDKGWIVDLVVKSKATNRIVSHESKRVGVLNSVGVYHVAFWLEETGCEPLLVTASVNGAHPATTADIPFSCGE